MGGLCIFGQVLFVLACTATRFDLLDLEVWRFSRGGIILGRHCRSGWPFTKGNHVPVALTNNTYVVEVTFQRRRVLRRDQVEA